MSATYCDAPLMRRGSSFRLTCAPRSLDAMVRFPPRTGVCRGPVCEPKSYGRRVGCARDGMARGRRVAPGWPSRWRAVIVAVRSAGARAWCHDPGAVGKAARAEVRTHDLLFG